MLTDSRKRPLEPVRDPSDGQMVGPQLRIANPPLRKIGHVAWFQERWSPRRTTARSFQGAGKRR